MYTAYVNKNEAISSPIPSHGLMKVVGVVVAVFLLLTAAVYIFVPPSSNDNGPTFVLSGSPVTTPEASIFLQKMEAISTQLINVDKAFSRVPPALETNSNFNNIDNTLTIISSSMATMDSKLNALQAAITRHSSLLATLTERVSELSKTSLATNSGPQLNALPAVMSNNRNLPNKQVRAATFAPSPHLTSSPPLSASRSATTPVFHSTATSTSAPPASSTIVPVPYTKYAYTPAVASGVFAITYQDILPVHVPTLPPMIASAPATPPLGFASILDISPLSAVHPYRKYAQYAATDIPAMRSAVAQEMRHAYGGFEVHAWGTDELKPVQRQGEDNFSVGLSVLDSLDTLFLMGHNDMFERGVEWVRNHMAIGPQTRVNLFEVTIRAVGGLLSAYSLAPHHTVLLTKATELVDACLFMFNTPTGLPFGTMTLHSQTKMNPHGPSTMAEMGTMQLEYQYLSRLTGNGVYKEKVNAVTKKIRQLNRALYTQFIEPRTGRPTDSTITFGARVDSLYEYFLKQWLLSGKDAGMGHVLEMYKQSMRAMGDTVLIQSVPGNLTFIAESHGGRLTGKMDHLVCFVPAMLALGVREGAVTGEEAELHLRWAEDLTRTCVEMYKKTKTGIAPEIVQFGVSIQQGGMSNRNGIGNKGQPGVTDFRVDPGAKHNLLRPETTEALYELYRTTRNPIYRAWGWELFLAWVKHCRIAGGGYSGLRNVDDDSFDERYLDTDHTGVIGGVAGGKPYVWANWNDKQESFFLAETLKYLFLLFSDDDPVYGRVFNTEAHLLPVDRGEGPVVASPVSAIAAGASTAHIGASPPPVHTASPQNAQRVATPVSQASPQQLSPQALMGGVSGNGRSGPHADRRGVVSTLRTARDMYNKPT